MIDSSRLLGLIMNILNQQAQAPKINSSPVMETAEEVIVTLEAPGIQKREDVYFSITATRVTIRGVRKKTAGAHLISENEISQERFEKTFQLPHPVRPESATALYSKGILELRIKKLPEKIWDRVFVQFL
ncbi:MAG: hypothetical protein JL50_01745 [Peptococcaceae bacterium BICA1-7]|nr:MAG: hypothetical protein JL50_01745 [Peptococcaceae bacterium BICA1-7]HBV96253.1 Hsp20/alpha crystallin family protein [Desulfotomaculum sp.]